MSNPLAIERTIDADGRVRLSAQGCQYTFHTLRPGAILMSIKGQELGQLGRAAIGEIAVEAARQAPLNLFIDMTGLSHVAEAVSQDWTAWFKANRPSLRRVEVLAPEPFVRLVVAVSQVFSRTESLIAIHNDPDKFAARVREQSPKATSVSAGD